MFEFFLGIIIGFSADGDVAFDAIPFASYEECRQIMIVGESVYTEMLPPGSDVRIACISSDKIGQNQV